MSLCRPVSCKLIQQYRGNHGLYQITVGCMSGQRLYFEDRFSIKSFNDSNNSLFIGVFDGHGSADCAEYLSSEFPNRIAKFPSRPVSNGDMITLCNSLDQEFLKRPWNKCECGSTATMAVITSVQQQGKDGLKDSSTADNKEEGFLAHICNVGDSRTIVISGSKVVCSTVDHKPSNANELLRIERAGGIYADEIGYVVGYDGQTGLAMSRSFGDVGMKRKRERPHKVIPNSIVVCTPQFQRHLCHQGDYILLASDGVFDVFESIELAHWVTSRLRKSTPSSPEECIRDLLDECSNRGSEDNMTVLLLEITPKSTSQQQQPPVGVGSSLPQQCKDSDGHQSSRVYIPGIYLPTYGKAFHSAYVSMVNYCSLTFQEALKARYEQVKSQLQATPANATSPSKTPKSKLMKVTQLNREIELEKLFYQDLLNGGEVAVGKKQKKSNNKSKQNSPSIPINEDLWFQELAEVLQNAATQLPTMKLSHQLLNSKFALAKEFITSVTDLVRKSYYKRWHTATATTDTTLSQLRNKNKGTKNQKKKKKQKKAALLNNLETTESEETFCSPSMMSKDKDFSLANAITSNSSSGSGGGSSGKKKRKRKRGNRSRPTAAALAATSPEAEELPKAKKKKLQSNPTTTTTTTEQE